MSRKNIISTVILGTCFVLSLTLFLINQNRYTKISFMFNYELEDKIVYEDRYIRLNGDKLNQAKMILDELFLGPMSVFNKKIFNYGYKYNKFYINRKTAYLDLPLSTVTYTENSGIVLEDAINLIKKNLLRNISSINEVIITVDGNLLGAGPSLSQLPTGDLDEKK
ncbi:hypothetical protein EW093_00450 [Thiospirochaeta perfilievii]|uniref:GerMN domain-containing protein n=1 Tax=Thiospirochaeta perfilievii TaxID=252967 RepID=A0A5C1Q998_9SPIO|nr:GerMN domain-containing protein [Thiospirochaeta perfilievii]QEN03234.1 hypothetical protein EW093_00450 [Thiospirochaeta perfilievii]